MSHAVQVPQGYASRILRTSLPLGVVGLYAESLGIWHVIVIASPERISLFFADSWVLGMASSGYNLIMEEMDWVGHHPARRNVVFCLTVGEDTTDALLGDLKSEFEIITLEEDATGIYAGFTSHEFQISVLKDEALGFPVIVHPDVQRIAAVHKIDTEVFRIFQFKEHVMFTGLWWSPIGSDRLSPNFAHADEEDIAAWKALNPEWGVEALMEPLEALIRQCVLKRGAAGLPEGVMATRYAARSAVDSVSQYLKNFDAGAVFVADMREAIARWELLREDEDEELKKQLTKALEKKDMAFGICSGIMFARRHGLPPPEAATDEDKEDGATGAPDETNAEQDVSTDPPVKAGDVLEAEVENKQRKVVSSIAGIFQEDEDLTPYCRHLRIELETLAAKQHALNMHRQKLELLVRQKAYVEKVYSAAMRDFQSGNYNTAKEGFFECLKLGTLYLTGADPQLSSAYYNAGRALHLAGVLAPAKEILKTCLQLRMEQQRVGIVDQATIDKTKQAFQQCLQDCHQASQSAK